jgi:hypothetical protein
MRSIHNAASRNPLYAMSNSVAAAIQPLRRGIGTLRSQPCEMTGSGAVCARTDGPGVQRRPTVHCDSTNSVLQARLSPRVGERGGSCPS